MSATERPDDSDAVRTFEKPYPVRRHHEVYRYRVTIPRDMLDEAAIEDRDKLGVKLDHENGFAVIVYTTNLNDADLRFTVSKHTTGELSIPSAIGAALDLAGTDVQWSRVETDGEYEFRARTEARLPQVDTSSGSVLKSKPFKHVTQQVERDEGEWEQEYFRAYLNSEENREDLGWGADQKVAVRIVRVNDVPSIVLSPDLDGASEKSIKNVIWTNKNYHEAREEPIPEEGEDTPDQDVVVYVPNDVVRALGFVEQDLIWVALNGALIFVPKN